MHLVRNCVALTLFLFIFHLSAFGQLDGLFASFDCREHAEFFHEVVFESIEIDSSMLVIEEPVLSSFDTINGWKQWNIVENYSFGKDRGTLTMITDLNALHPYFRDQVRQLILNCRAKGIELAVVETFRTHAKQNEYKGMGRKYTNSAGGKSKHQYGLAVDLVPIVNGQPVWDNQLLWKKVGFVGEKLGLRWGGRWRKPYDPAHFEWTGGLSSNHLSIGIFPVIPQKNYPCVDEDLAILRKYWSEWEAFQGSMTRR